MAVAMPRTPPYQRDHERANEQRMDTGRMPRGIDGLLRWYMAAVREETPDRLHRRGLWWSEGMIVRGFPVKDGYQGDAGVKVTDAGGSHIGTPADSPEMRRYMERSPHATDDTNHYHRPLGAALAKVSKRWPLMARFLLRLAQSGDWRAVASRMSLHDEIAEVYVEESLRRLWLRYREMPERND